MRVVSIKSLVAERRRYCVALFRGDEPEDDLSNMLFSTTDRLPVVILTAHLLDARRPEGAPMNDWQDLIGELREIVRRYGSDPGAEW